MTKKTRGRQRGMSLVELIVLLSLIAILSAVALPNYSEYKRRADRIDARSTLLHISAQQERYYASNLTYTSDLTKLGVNDSQSEHGLYALSIASANDVEFQVIAVPAPDSPQVKDKDCQQFSIDNRNVRVASPDPDGNCW